MNLIHAMPSHILDWKGEYQTLYSLELCKIAKRRYRLKAPVELEVKTDVGVLYSKFDAGFEFDGRSGPGIIDWYAPNLGTIFERIAWLNHDGCAYATSLDFKSTNRLLSIWLRDEACYSSLKSKIIETAVSLSKSWFGVPDKDDPWYCNLGKFNLEFICT